MAGTLGALRLIERTAVSLCRAVDDAARALDRALPNEGGRGETSAPAAKALINQLKLWRAAWGPADDPVPLDQIIALATGLPSGVAVDLSALPGDVVWPAPVGRIVLNILLLAADSLPAGGRILLVGTADDLFVQIDGPTAAWPVGLSLCLANAAEAEAALTDGRNMQMAVTTTLAHATNIRLSAVIPPSRQSEPAILHLAG